MQEVPYYQANGKQVSAHFRLYQRTTCQTEGPMSLQSYRQYSKRNSRGPALHQHRICRLRGTRTAKLPCSALLLGMLCHLAATSGPPSTAIAPDAVIRAARGDVLAAKTTFRSIVQLGAREHASDLKMAACIC